MKNLLEVILDTQLSFLTESSLSRFNMKILLEVLESVLGSLTFMMFNYIDGRGVSEGEKMSMGDQN